MPNLKTSAQRNFIPLLLATGLAVVLLNAWMAFSALTVLVHNQQSVEHTWEVIDQAERIMGFAKDAETGNRGFLITGDPTYLDPYTAAVRSLPPQLDLFQRLTADNPLQQHRLVDIRAVLEQRLALLDQSIELRRQGVMDSVQAMVVSGTGRAQMENLRRLADDAEAEERSLLAQRTAGAVISRRRARLAIGLASALDLLLLIFMFRYFHRERALRLASDIAAQNLAIAHRQSEARGEEVRQLNATLEERVRLRTAELETINRELEAFSYSVSHDLRARLRTIDGFSLALEEDYADAVDAVGRDYISRVRTGVQRMGQLIDALLQLSRITRAEIVREPFDLSAIARSLAADLQASEPGRDILFHIEDGLHADADPKLLRVALENLLNNAVKFSARVEHAVIDFGWDPGHKAWFVRDNGAGFDMHYAEKLFNAFNRLHGDKDFKGSGIGLATVARVIRRHHGTIWADSVVDHGATFWFTLG